MLRALHTLVTAVCLLLLVAVAALWVRSARRTDVFTLRTARSYAGWPGAKWLVLRDFDGLVFEAHVKSMPVVEVGSPPWREDVPPDFVVPVSESAEPAVVKRVFPSNQTRVTGASYREMTASEQRAYAAEIQPVFSAAPVLQWQTTPPQSSSMTPAAVPAVLRWLGVRWYGRDNFFVDEGAHAGVYRQLRLRLPFPLATAALAVAPASWLALSLRRRVVRRRRLAAGQCPQCAYDLRGGGTQCPECGRTVAPGEADRARRPFLRSLPADALGSLSRYPVRAGLALMVPVAAGAALWVARKGDASYGTATWVQDVREEVQFRRELDRQLDLLAREVERLRRGGDARAADSLAAELESFRRSQSGMSGNAGNGSAELDVVGVYEGDYPGGKPPLPTTAPGEPPVRSWADVPRNRHPQGVATVVVESTDRPIALALCAYEPVKWELRLAPGARLERVIVGGRSDHELVGVPAGVPVTNRATSGGGMVLNFFAYRRDTAAYVNAEEVLRQLARLPVTTFQGRYRAGQAPFVIGPRNGAWAAQRAVADLGPLYLRAERAERDATRGALRSLRFTALWRETLRGLPIGPPAEQSLAEFDPTGPIRSTLRTLPRAAVGAAFDPEAAAWYGSVSFTQNATPIGRMKPGTPRFDTTTAGQPFPRRAVVHGIAFDPRRRRLMVLAGDSTGPRSYFFSPDDDTWSVGGQLGPGRGYSVAYGSVTYSDADECFYALGVAWSGTGQLQAIVKISAQGIAEWRIPVNERLTDNLRRGPSWPPQIAAAGKYLAILTPPLPDPLDPDAPEAPRCVLIDPKTNTVQYSGPMTPHPGEASGDVPGSAGG